MFSHLVCVGGGCYISVAPVITSSAPVRLKAEGN